MPQMMFRPPPMRPGLQALGMRMPPSEFIVQLLASLKIVYN